MGSELFNQVLVFVWPFLTRAWCCICIISSSLSGMVDLQSLAVLWETFTCYSLSTVRVEKHFFSLSICFLVTVFNLLGTSGTLSHRGNLKRALLASRKTPGLICCCVILSSISDGCHFYFKLHDLTWLFVAFCSVTSSLSGFSVVIINTSLKLNEELPQRESCTKLMGQWEYTPC